MVEKINLAEKFSQITALWKPKIVAEINDSYVKIAKIKGEFDWHKHQHEDEMFLVIKGEMEMHYRDKIVVLQMGEMTVVPMGVEHRPVAKDTVEIMMIEKKTTINTGDVVTKKTTTDLEWI